MRDRCWRRMAELLPCCCLAPPCVASCSPYARVSMRVPAWPRGERAAMAGAGVLHARAACVTGWAAMYRMMSADTANTHTAGACCIPRLLWSPIQVPPPSLPPPCTCLALLPISALASTCPHCCLHALTSFCAHMPPCAAMLLTSSRCLCTHPRATVRKILNLALEFRRFYTQFRTAQTRLRAGHDGFQVRAWLGSACAQCLCHMPGACRGCRDAQGAAVMQQS